MKSWFMPFLSILTLTWSVLGHAAVVPPDCLDHDRAPLGEMNSQVIQWKRSTRSGHLERARIHGKISQVWGIKGDHWHFEIDLESDGSTEKKETGIEVIYNRAFGDIAEVKIGMEVEACGDYITSTQRNGPYPPSPSGAIIHWVHANTRGGGHQNGYLVVNDRLYGQSDPKKP